MAEPSILSATPVEPEAQTQGTASILSATPVSEEETGPAYVYDEETDTHVGVPSSMNEVEVEHVIKVGTQQRNPGEFLGAVDTASNIDRQARMDIDQRGVVGAGEMMFGLAKGAVRMATYDMPKSVMTILENRLRAGALVPSAMKQAGLDRKYWSPMADKQADAVKALQAKHTKIMTDIGLAKAPEPGIASVAEDIGAVGGQIGTQLGLGLLTGNPLLFGAVFGGALTMGDQIDKAQGAGETPENAFNKSILPTTLVGMLEGLGNGALVKAVSKNARVGKYVAGVAEWIKSRPMLNAAGLGAAQESTQQVVTEAWEKINQWDDDTVQEIAGSVVYAGVLGFITMGAIGAVTVENARASLKDNPAFQDLTPQEQDVVLGEIMANVENNDGGILDEAIAVVSRQADPKLLGYSDPALLTYDGAKQSVAVAQGDVPALTTTPKQDVMDDGDGFERKAVTARRRAIKTELEDVNRQIVGLEKDHQKAIDTKTQAQVAVARNLESIDKNLTQLEEAYSGLELITPAVREEVQTAKNKATYTTDLGVQRKAYDEAFAKAMSVDERVQYMTNMRTIGQIQRHGTKNFLLAIKLYKAEFGEMSDVDAAKALSARATELEQAGHRSQQTKKILKDTLETLRTSRITGDIETRVGALQSLMGEVLSAARQDAESAKTTASLVDSETRAVIAGIKAEIKSLKSDRTLLKSINTSPDAKLAHSLYKKISDLKRRRLLLVREEALLNFSQHWEQENPVLQMTLEQFTAEHRADFAKRVKAFRDGYRKGIKTGTKETQTSIAAVQKEFTDFINDNVPAPMAKKAVNKIKDATTPEKMERLMKRLQTQIDIYEKKVLFQDIKKFAAKIKYSKTIDVNYLNEINTILAQVGVTHPKTLQARISVLSENTMAKVIEGVPSDVQHIVLQHLWAVTEKKMSEMSYGELSALKASLMALAEEGYAEQKKHQAILQAYKQEFIIRFGELGKDPVNRARIIKTLPPGRIWDKLSKKEQFAIVFDKMRADIMSAPGMLKEGLTRLDMNLMPMEVVMDMFDRSAAYYNGPHIEYIWKPMNQGFSQYLDVSYKTNEQVKKLAQRLKLNEDNFVRIGVYAMLKQENGIEKVLGSGYGQETQMSTKEVLKTPAGQKALEQYAADRGVDITEAEEMVLDWAEQADIQKLMELGLLPEEQQFYDHMQSVLADIFPLLKETSRIYHNLDLKQINGYLRMETDFEASRDMLLQDKFAEATGTITPARNVEAKKTKTESGMVKKRLGGKNAVKLNAYEILTKYVNDAYYYVHLTPYLEGAKTIVQSSEYRTTVGDIPQSYMVDWLDTVARRGGQEGAYHNKALEGLRQNGYLAILSWRATTMLLQSTAAITAMSEIPGQTIGYGMGKIWATTSEGKQIRKWLGDNFPTYLARSLDDPALFDNFNQSMLDEIMNGKLAPLSGIKQMDKITAGAVLFAAYHHYFNMNGLKAPSSAELLANPPDINAARYAETIMNRTQGSPFFINLPQILSRGKGFGGNAALAKLLMMLNTYNIMVPWRTVRYDGIQAGLKRKDIGKMMGATGAVAGSMLAGNALKMVWQGIVSTLFPEPPPEDDEDEEIPRGLLDIYLEKTMSDAVRTIPFASNAAALSVNEKMGSVILDELGSIYTNLERAAQARRTIKKQNLKDGPNETTIEKAQRRALRNNLEAMYTTANWLAPIGSGPMRVLFNEQVKEIGLDLYDTVFDNKE